MLSPAYAARALVQQLTPVSQAVLQLVPSLCHSLQPAAQPATPHNAADVLTQHAFHSSSISQHPNVWGTSAAKDLWGVRYYSSTSQGNEGTQGPTSGDSGQEKGQIRMTLGEALTSVVDAAVELVEKGETENAVALLKEGIATFEPNFPDSPELGELHNQVALLSLMAGDADGAVQHATSALAITRKHFSETGSLVGHRKLRLGVAQFAQGRLTDAATLLNDALEALTSSEDQSRFEARFYLGLSVLSGTRDLQQVSDVQQRLLADITALKEVFGADSMIVSLALSQHDRVVHQPLSATEPDTQLCEAMLTQHAKLIEAIKPESEDLAVAHYKLATFYYVNDMLPDAQKYVRKAGTALRAVMPDEHPLVAMCKHRLGMICAVSGDHRAATQLLEGSKKHLGATAEDAAQPGAVSGLAREADFGLAVAKYKALPAGAGSAQRKEALQVMRSRLDELAAAIGVNHMLARGAMRYFAQMNVMSKA